MSGQFSRFQLGERQPRFGEDAEPDRGKLFYVCYPILVSIV